MIAMQDMVLLKLIARLVLAVAVLGRVTSVCCPGLRWKLGRVMYGPL